MLVVMGFRDDREAMRAHVETLKEQLDEQRDTNAEMRKQIDTLGKRVDVLEPAPTSRAGRKRSLYQALIVAAITGSLCALVVSRLMLPDEPSVGVEPEAEVRDVATRDVVPTPPPATPPVVPRPRLPEPPSAYQGMAEWVGTVSATEGRDDVATGDRCVVRAEARSLAFRLAPERLEVGCGDTMIYERVVSRRARPNAFERWECQVRGQRESSGGLYAMSCTDRGVHADRPELELDTLTKSARLWTGEFFVQISLAHAAVRTPEEMNPNIEMSLPFQEGIERRGEVIRSNGPVASGTTCRLLLVPSEPSRRRREAHHNCQATLTCAGAVVVARPASCLVDEDLVLTGVRIVDDESPIALDGDLRQLRVASIGEERTWHAVVRLGD